MALRSLAQTHKLGDLTLRNRIVMSAMTRNRSPGTIPTPLNAEYYAQRASAGLIVTEGIFVEPLGSEWSHVPGLWTEEQVEGWKTVTDAVHAKGGLIFAQLWHIGRVAHPLLQCGVSNVGPSAIAAKGGKFRQLEGAPGYVKPVAIKDPWIYVEKFRNAAKNAKAAGFDGVEVHSANGYLPHQFIETHSNQRTDEWGGSPQQRAKFTTEVAKACVDVYGPKRVGVKLSPCGGYNDMGDPLPELTANYTAVINNLDALNVGYIVICRHLDVLDPTGRGTKFDVYPTFKPLIKNAQFWTNGGFSGQEADKLIEDKVVEAVCFGAPYITNPDLADRLLKGQALNFNFEPKLFYTPPEDNLGLGYTSYPPFSE